MTHQHPVRAAWGDPDAGSRLAQLAELEALVARIADVAPPAAHGAAALDRDARLSTAYDDASPIVRKRFDALAQETALWAAAGVEALLHGSGAPAAAAVQLRAELAMARSRLAAMLPA